MSLIGINSPRFHFRSSLILQVQYLWWQWHYVARFAESYVFVDISMKFLDFLLISTSCSHLVLHFSIEAFSCIQGLGVQLVPCTIKSCHYYTKMSQDLTPEKLYDIQPSLISSKNSCMIQHIHCAEPHEIINISFSQCVNMPIHESLKIRSLQAVALPGNNNSFILFPPNHQLMLQPSTNSSKLRMH